MNTDNSKKVRSGSNAKKEIHSLITELKNEFKNVKFKKKDWGNYVTFGFPNKDPHQFKIDEVIIFDDENLEIWLIKISSSVRGDRCKGAEFDIEHVKKLLSSKSDNVKAFYVIKDNQSPNDLKQFTSYKKNVTSHKIVSYFDDILKFSEFQNMLKERCVKYLIQGVQSNILGNDAEKEISDSFNNINNTVLWNNPEDSVTQSKDIYIFLEVMNALFSTHNPIQQTEAFNNNKLDKHHFLDELNIVRNSEGKGNLGKPKTDVLVQLSFSNGTYKKIKISVKKPKAASKRVTIHEGSIESLISDLRTSLPSNSRFNNSENFDYLSQALLNFQEVGSAKNMNPDFREYLNNYLSELNGWLIDYFLFGINNTRFNDNQIANTLAIINPDNGSLIVKKDTEEKELLLKYCESHKLGSSSFGTPFSWTYPSKKKGRKIQIKSPLPF